MADLTTLAAVRSFLQKPAADPSQDTYIDDLIPNVTAAIESYCQREFTDRGNLTRRFAWTSGPLRLSPYDLRAATSIVLYADQSYSQTLTAGTDYTLRPITPTDGVHGWVRITPGSAPGATWALGTVPPFSPEKMVDITGSWGFAAVPAPVVQAANITVKEWLESANTYNPGLTEDLGASDNTPGYLSAIPYAARMLLSPYKRPDVF